MSGRFLYEFITASFTDQGRYVLDNHGLSRALKAQNDGAFAIVAAAQLALHCLPLSLGVIHWGGLGLYTVITMTGDISLVTTI
jgi:hypothetical protein